MIFLKNVQFGPDDPEAAVTGRAATNRLIKEAWIDSSQAMRDNSNHNLPRGVIGNGHKQSGQAGKSTSVRLSQFHDSIQNHHRSCHFYIGHHGGNSALAVA